MAPEIVWKRAPCRTRAGGWECYLGAKYIGIVYTDGAAYIGNGPIDTSWRPQGSPHMRALEMVRYIEAGGR